MTIFRQNLPILAPYLQSPVLKKKNYILLLLIVSGVISLNSLYSQALKRPNAWKKYRKELILQVGASGFLGDLGGRDAIGKDFSPVDLNITATRPAVGAAFRYKFNKNVNWLSSFNYLLLSGNDKLTNEQYRNNRNLNFKSNVFAFKSFSLLNTTALALFIEQKIDNESDNSKTPSLT